MCGGKRIGCFAGGFEESGFGGGEFRVFGGAEFVDVVGGAEGGGDDLLVDGLCLELDGCVDRGGAVGVDALDGLSDCLKLGGVGELGEFDGGDVVDLADLHRGDRGVEQVVDELRGEGLGWCWIGVLFVRCCELHGVPLCVLRGGGN